MRVLKSQERWIITALYDSVFPVATIVNDARNQIDIYGEDIEVDYRGYEVR